MIWNSVDRVVFCFGGVHFENESPREPRKSKLRNSKVGSFADTGGKDKIQNIAAMDSTFS